MLHRWSCEAYTSSQLTYYYCSTSLVHYFVEQRRTHKCHWPRAIRKLAVHILSCPLKLGYSDTYVVSMIVSNFLFHVSHVSRSFDELLLIGLNVDKEVFVFGLVGIP